MSGQAPTNSFRAILDCTGKDGEQEAAEEGEVCVPLFPSLSHPPGSLIPAGGGRRCSPRCSFLLELCVMNRGEIPALCSFQGSVSILQEHLGPIAMGDTRGGTGTRQKEPKKGKAPKPQRVGTRFSSLSLHSGVSRAPFPVRAGMGSPVEPPWETKTRCGKHRGFSQVHHLPLL